MTHKDYSSYQYRPLLFDAKEAHENGTITYEKNGEVTLQLSPTHKEVIPLAKQFSLIRPTFEDLNKALSQLANSPSFDRNKTLRQLFDEALEHYETLVDQIYGTEKWEPDYGMYLYDVRMKELYLIAPELWHRLGLVTNNSKLFTDPSQKLSWQEIRGIFDNAHIGFIGASVGGNILEGVCREIRPKQIKVADPDWVEITNLNRLERGTIRHLSASKAEKKDPKNPYEVMRVNKAELAAYGQHLLDPYATWYVYSEGLHHDNIEQFLLGNGKDEPRLDMVIEEADDLRLKIEVRRLCQKYGIPLLMMSDFGHIVEGQFQDFKKNPQTPLGHKVTDAYLMDSVHKAMTSGKREDRFAFIADLCGPEYARDEFGLWVEGKGEQPTSSLPQSGATALASGGIGAKLIAAYLLGYSLPQRVLYDLKRGELIKEEEAS